MATRQRICWVWMSRMSRVLADAFSARFVFMLWLARLADIRQAVLRGLARLDDIRQAVLPGLARLADTREFGASGHSLKNTQLYQWFYLCHF
jgi:hypothetical protein